MTIGITGLQGSGKSTLAHTVASSLKSQGDSTWVLAPSVGSLVRDQGRSVGHLADYETQHIFAFIHLNRIRTINALGQNSILDRCPLDHLAYLKALDIISPEYMALQEELVEWGINAIDYIFICEELSVENISTHEPAAFRARVKYEFEMIIRKYKYKCTYVQGDIETRTKAVLNHISEVTHVR